MTETKTEILHMRISPELKKALADAAERDGRTMANYVEQLIKQAVSKQDR